MLEHHGFIGPLVTWPQGLDILLASYPYRITRPTIDKLWEVASRSAGPASWEVLLPHVVDVSQEDWDRVYYGCKTPFIRQDFDESYLKAVVIAIAGKLRPHKLDISDDLER